MAKRKRAKTKASADKKKTSHTSIKPLNGKYSDFSGIVLKAAARGDLPAVDRYLQHRPEWLNDEGPHGRTMLWEAAYKGRTEMVRELLRRGANVSAMGSYYTPLLVELTPRAAARLRGHDEVVALLKEHGARDDLYSASHRGDLAAIKRFLKRRPASVNVPSKQADPHRFMGYHPIHYAVAGKQLEAVELLVENGADVADHLPLLIKWADGNGPIVQFLKSVAPKAKTTFPAGPLQKKATRNKNIPGIDRPGYLGFPPLVEACRGNHNAPDDPYRVQELLDRGANIHVQDYKGKTGLHRAAQAGFVKITKLLLKSGADVRAVDDKGDIPAFDAAYHGRTETLKLLLKQRKADTRATASRGETLLFAAARRGHVDTVRTLLALGCEADHTNDHGKTAAEVVAAARHQTTERKQILRLLAEKQIA